MFHGGNLFSVLLVVFAILEGITSRKLPSYVQTCKRSDKEFDQCLLKSAESIRPYLTKGIPKIRVPPLEPMHIPRLDINRDLENLKLRATLKDIKIWGITDYQIKRIRTNLNKLGIEATIAMPHLYVTAEYDVDGRLLVVPLRGKGLFKGNITDTVADIKATADVATNSKGLKHLIIKTISTKIKVGDQRSSFVSKDADANNALITETAAIFINQNRRQVLDIVTPIGEETVVAFVKQIGNNILKVIPLSEILPD